MLDLLQGKCTVVSITEKIPEDWNWGLSPNSKRKKIPHDL